MTRVELHNEHDYTALHKAMALGGFSRTITGSNSKKYHLPTGQYSIEANLTIDQVRERAATAALSTGKSYAVLVTEGESAWTGLDQVKAPQAAAR